MTFILLDLAAFWSRPALLISLHPWFSVFLLCLIVAAVGGLVAHVRGRSRRAAATIGFLVPIAPMLLLVALAVGGGNVMGILLFWLIMGGVVAMIANSKGLSGLGWFLYGALIWPIALVHVLVTKPAAAHEEQTALASGGKKCPRCAEIVKADAQVCRFCNHEFVALAQG